MQYDQPMFNTHPHSFHSVVYSNRAKLRVILQTGQAETPPIQLQSRSIPAQGLTLAAIRSIFQKEINLVSKHCANSSSDAQIEVTQFAVQAAQPVSLYISQGLPLTIGLKSKVDVSAM